jgi:hypothetical protein
MGLKNIDFKQLFLQKGERIALVICLAIMGLLLVIYGISSVVSAGPQSHTEEIDRLRAVADSSWRSSQPTPGLENLPDDLQVAERKKVNADLYACSQLYFQLLEREDKKWRLPVVLAPDEFQADLIRSAYQSYIFGKDGKGELTIAVLKEKPAADKMSEEDQKKRRESLKRVPGMLESVKKRLAASRTQMIRPPTPPGGGESTLGGGGGEGGLGVGLPGDKGASAAIKEMDLKFVLVEKIGEEQGILAEAYTPIRFVEITGMFPYKLQLEEFRKALRMNTVEELFLEPESTPEFSGFNVQRRVYTLDGKMLNKDVNEGWEDLDIETPIKTIRARAKEVEPEDQTLLDYNVIVRPNKLVVPVPKLARNQRYPDPKLEGLKQTIQEQDRLMKENAPPPPKPKSRFKGELDDIFDIGENETTRRRSGDEGMPAGGGLPLRPGTPAGGGPKRPGGGDAGIGLEGGPSSGSLINKPQAFPEKCLFRFIDPTVVPGLAYEYRIQIKMHNPAYDDQKERAVSKKMTKEKDILGPWQEISWKEGDQKVSRMAVSDELLYYVMDEQKPAGAPPTANPGKPEPQNEDRLAVQIHDWLGEIRSKPGQQSNLIDVGDWSVLERRLVHRGEYLGKIHEVEIPVWITPLNRPGLAIHPDEQVQRKGQPKRIIKHKGVPVDFSADPVYENKALLIDFEGVDRIVGGGSRPPRHTGPVEMLILTADGRLIVRNSVDDTANQERKDRVTAWAAWLNYVRNLADEDSSKKQQLFDRPGGKGPGGS